MFPPSAAPSFSSAPAIPAGVVIDEKIVSQQKDKALKELNSRVTLALSQQEQMYKVQKEHIVADAGRQIALTKSAIDAQKQQALMQLEQEYAQNTMGIDHAAQHQRFQIEQIAMQLDVQALQQKMVLEHQAREREWNTGNMASFGAPPLATPSYVAPASSYVAPANYQQ